MNINTFTSTELTLINSLLNANQNIVQLILLQIIDDKIKSLISSGAQAEILGYASINTKLKMSNTSSLNAPENGLDPVSFHITIDH